MGGSYAELYKRLRFAAGEGLNQAAGDRTRTIGPVYWRASNSELSQSDVEHDHFKNSDGFSCLEKLATERWSAFANCCRNAEIKLNTMKEMPAKPMKGWPEKFIFSFKQLNKWIEPDEIVIVTGDPSTAYRGYSEPEEGDSMSLKENMVHPVNEYLRGVS